MRTCLFRPSRCRQELEGSLRRLRPSSLSGSDPGPLRLTQARRHRGGPPAMVDGPRRVRARRSRSETQSRLAQQSLTRSQRQPTGVAESLRLELSILATRNMTGAEYQVTAVTVAALLNQVSSSQPLQAAGRLPRLTAAYRDCPARPWPRLRGNVTRKSGLPQSYTAAPVLWL